MIFSALISIANLIYVYVIPNGRFVFRGSYILEPIAFLVVVFLTFFNHSRTRTSSAILLLFWPVYSVLFIAWSRTYFARHIIPSNVVYALRCSSFALGLVSFIIEYLGPEIGEKESIRESPILKANIFSIWFFGWMTPLMKRGVTQYITEADLPPLPPKDQSVHLGQELDHALSKQ